MPFCANKIRELIKALNDSVPFFANIIEGFIQQGALTFNIPMLKIFHNVLWDIRGNLRHYQPGNVEALVAVNAIQNELGVGPNHLPARANVAKASVCWVMQTSKIT